MAIRSPRFMARALPLSQTNSLGYVGVLLDLVEKHQA